MPIDASIYGLIQQPKINTPFENLRTVMDLRTQEENARGLREQREALAAQTRERTQLLQQQQADTAAIDAAFQQGKSPEEILGLVPGHLRDKIQKQFAEANDYNDKVQKAKREAEQAERDYFGHLAASVKSYAADGPQAMLNAAQAAIRTAKAHGHDTSEWEAALAQDPSKLPQLLDGVIAFAQGPQKPKDDYTLGNQRFSGATNQPIAAAPKEPTKPASAQEYEYAKTQGYKGTYEQYQNEDANRKRPVVNVNAGEGLDDAGRELLATQYRVVGSSAIPTRISGADRAKIINQAAAQMKALGQSPAAAIQRQYALKADAGSLNKISTMAATASAFENKAIQQADLVRELSQRVDRTKFPILNQALLTGKKDILGDADTQLLYNALTTFTAEYAKIIEGSTGSVAGSTDAARKASANLAHAALSKETLAKTLDLMQKEMRYTIQGYDATKDAITAKMGGVPQSAASTPSAPPAAETPEHRYWRVSGKQGPEPK